MVSTSADIYAKSLRIATRDRSNLYLVSRFFEDREKFLAFISFYALMRIVDDAVDSMTQKSGRESDTMLRYLDRMESSTMVAYEPRGSALAVEQDPLFAALGASVRKFPIPREVWQNFFASMRKDATTSRFDTLPEFIEYCEGATVAPTVIFVYLLTSRRGADGRYTVHDFDWYTCGRHLGIFAYLAHILRDVKEDLENDLVYLPRRELESFGLTEEDLQAMSRGEKVSKSFRRLVAKIAGLSRDHLRKGKAMAEEIYPRMDPDCHFIFSLIIRMYESLLDRIEAVRGDVFSGRHTLATMEKLKLAFDVATETAFPSTKVRSVLDTLIGTA